LFAGAPGNEAHGGYTFCGLSAAMIYDHCRARLRQTRANDAWDALDQEAVEFALDLKLMLVSTKKIGVYVCVCAR
jgi:hypothetical protein